MSYERTPEIRAKQSAALRGRVFSAETRAKMSAAARGRRHSAETRAKMSASHLGLPCSEETRCKIRVALLGVKCPQRGRPGHTFNSVESRARCAKAIAKLHASGHYFKGPTGLELALRKLLQTAGLEFQEQVRFGRYVVDAYVSSHNLVFEADGSFWYSHKDREREARRDAYLVGRGAVAVVHLTEDDLIPWRKDV